MVWRVLLLVHLLYSSLIDGLWVFSTLGIFDAFGPFLVYPCVNAFLKFVCIRMLICSTSPSLLAPLVFSDNSLYVFVWERIPGICMDAHVG